MTISRRNLAAAGALAFGAAGVLSNVAAAKEEGEGGISEAVEALRQAILKQDKAQLEKLTAEKLSYGHSSAVVQDKAEFVNGVMTRKGTVKSIDFTDLKISLAGDAAIVRHGWHSESEVDGKPHSTKLGVLAVWHRRGGDWKLLARQGYKLPDA